MDIRNLLQGKELSVCLFQRLHCNFHFYKFGSRTQYLRLERRYISLSRKKASVTLPYKIKLHKFFRVWKTWTSPLPVVLRYVHSTSYYTNALVIHLHRTRFRFSLVLRYFARFTTVPWNLKSGASFPTPLYLGISSGLYRTHTVQEFSTESNR